MPIVFISHSDCLQHDIGKDHPEQPGRLHAIQDQLISSGMDMAIHQIDAPLATQEQIARTHNSDYVAKIFKNAPSEGILRLDDDTFMTPKTLPAALRAAGAVIHGVDLVMNKEAGAAFCATRPPGHHAELGEAMGFCYFNNIAVGATHAMEKYGLDRIAIIDFDVHHGNGTEDIFRNDPRVFFGSSFQHPFYPFSGHDTNSDHIINIPLAAGTKGPEFREKVEQLWLPALEKFKPQLIMISAGFDAHHSDEMSHVLLHESDYKWITHQLKLIADKYAEGRIVSTLEGGYNLRGLARCVVAHLDALLG